MEFYIVIIILSVFLFSVANRNYKRKPIFIFFYSAFVLLLSLLGGLRDESVGSDIATYGIAFFEDAKYASSLWSLLQHKTGEWGFHILMWICTRISGDIHFMFFVEELIKILLVSSTALYFREKLNATLFVFAYLTFFYFVGFSAMRQLLAMSVFIYSLRYYFNGEHLKYILFGLLAMAFHSSGIFAFLIYFIRYLHWESLKKNVFVHLGIMLLIYVFSMTIMNYLMFNNLGVYSEKAELYMEREGAVTAKTNILLAIALLILSCFCKFWKKNRLEYSIYIVLIIYNLFFLFMSPQFEVAFRVSWYQIPFMIILFLRFARLYVIKKRLFLNITYISLFILHFVIASIHGLSGTIPYSSRILGF